METKPYVTVALIEQHGPIEALRMSRGGVATEPKET